MRWILPFCLLALPAFADTCPPAPDHSVQEAEITRNLGRAQSQGEANALNAQLWALWTDAPDAQAQALLDEGMSKRSVYDFLGARDTFDQLVEYCPDYAEGYNQRAFASFLRGDYEAALFDLDKTLSINPTHIGALSGKGLTLIELGREAEAQEALRAAVTLNPWLSERALLTEPLPQEL